MQTDWRNLPAGPELDCIILERVFGWEPKRNAMGDRIGWAGGPFGITQCSDVDTGRVSPSRQIEAAWLVVEAMEARGTRYCLNLRRAHPGGPWKAYFAPYLRETEADTAPMAICLAALAALEVERG